MAQQIHWFPGHMNKALNEVETKVKLVDVVIELLDARAPLSSINENLEKLIQNKKKLIILTKIDLADQDITKEWINFFKQKYDSVLTLDLKKSGAENILSKAVITFDLTFSKSKTRSVSLIQIILYFCLVMLSINCL